MQLYNVLLNNKIPFVLLENDASENVIYCTEFTEHFFGVGEFATKTKPVILEYVTENDAKYVTTSITLEDGTCFNNVKFKVVQTKNILHSTINFNKLTDKEQVEFVEEEPQQIIQEEVVLPLPQPPSVQIDFKKEYQQQAYKALKEQQKTIPNLKQAYLNKLPLPLIVDNTTDNIIYCSNFKDYLFNVGIFQTKTKEVILEYTISADEKYVTGDVIFENGESYHQVKFRVVISEEIEVPYSTFNPVYAGRKYTDSIPLPPKPLPVPEIEEPLTEAEIFVQEQIVDKKREYEEAARLALLQQKKLQRETKELEQKKQQYENNKIVQETIDSYKQELLAEYLNTLNKQSELLDDRAKKSIEEAEHAVHKNILTIFDKYKNQLTHSVEELKNESLEQLTTTLSTHIDESKKGLEDLLTQWTANTDSKLTETLVSKVRLLEEQYQDKLLVELEKHKISLFHEFKTVSSQAINSALEKKTADTTEIITNLFASKESQLQQTFELQIKDAYEELHGLVEHFKDKLPAISKNIQTLEERVKKLLEEKRQAAKVTEFNKEQKEYIATTAQYWARRILDLGGGGGSVAVQYAKGGTMDGTLNVNGQILSGGRDISNYFGGGGGGANQTLSFNEANANLSISSGNTVSLSALSGAGSAGDATVNLLVRSNSGYWDEAYSNLVANSANYLSGFDVGFITSNFVHLSGDIMTGALSVPTISSSNIQVSNSVGIGTITPITKLDIEGDASSNSLLKVGSLEFQPYALNNAWIGENVYDNGINFVRRQSGAAGLFYFQGSEGQFRFADNNDADTVVPPNIQLKISYDGQFGVGSTISYETGEFTGSNLYVATDGKTGIGTITPATILDVNGVITASGGNSDQWNSNYTTVNANSGSWQSVYTTTNTNSANYILDGGNAKSADLSVGTNDNFSLTLETANIRRLFISNTGELTGFNPQAAFNVGLATGTNSFAIGAGAARGTRSFAQGNNTISSGTNSYSEGSNTSASGSSSHAEGTSTQASNTNSHSEGSGSVASGQQSHAEGTNTIASGTASHAEGQGTIASGNRSHTEGTSVSATNTNSHAEGSSTLASGLQSHTEGTSVSATNTNSHAEGQLTLASGVNSHSEGRDTVSSGTQSHAEGLRSISLGSNSHAEGRDTIASGDGSHAEGNNTRAIGINAHVEGSDNTVDGNYSHAAGRYASAVHNNTWIWQGDSTAVQQISTTRTGQFMVSAVGGVYFPGNVGIGTDNNSNALTVTGTISTNKIESSAFIATRGAINNQTGTEYILSNQDNGKIITLSNTSPVTASVPAGLPVGFNAMLIQINTGQVVVSAGPGVTINSDGGKRKITSQHSTASLISYSANTFNLAGNLTA